MEKLIQGLHRFQSSLGTHEREFYADLAQQGRRPLALFITCSDARVIPQLITQARPGELFVLQNAGALVPRWRPPPAAAAEAATIEYAIKALKVRDIVICAHSQCGTMTALADDRPMDDLPALGAWLRHAAKTRRLLHHNYAELAGEARLDACTRANVLVQLDNLRTHPAVRDACEAGELQLHGWLYLIASGEVLGWAAESGQFEPVGKTRSP